MGASLWDQLWLPLLTGVASSILVAALCFLSVRLWNCLMKQVNCKATARVGERDHDQPRPVGDADDANALPDLEMGTANGREVPLCTVGESVHAQPLPESDTAAHASGVPDLEMGNGSGAPAEGGKSMTNPEMELGIVNSGEVAPKTQVTRDAASKTGVLVPVEIRTFLIPSKPGRTTE